MSTDTFADTGTTKGPGEQHPSMTVEVRPYDPERDREALWEHKRAFERELGSETGGSDKQTAYEEKLTTEYRERYLAWVERCLADEPRAVTVATVGGDPAGYVFVLPESLALIWDAAVLNEIYVAPDHRGEGVSDALMDAAVDVARKQDLPIDRLVLDVDGDNERAAGFYDRHDFDHWGEMVARPL